MNHRALLAMMAVAIGINTVAFAEDTERTAPFTAAEIKESFEQTKAVFYLWNALAMFAQLAHDRPEDTGADRLALVVDEDGGVAVEADHRAVGTAHGVRGAHDD